MADFGKEQNMYDFSWLLKLEWICEFGIIVVLYVNVLFVFQSSKFNDINCLPIKLIIAECQPKYHYSQNHASINHLIFSNQ